MEGGRAEPLPLSPPACGRGARFDATARHLRLHLFMGSARPRLLDRRLQQPAQQRVPQIPMLLQIPDFPLYLHHLPLLFPQLPPLLRFLPPLSLPPLLSSSIPPPPP